MRGSSKQRSIAGAQKFIWILLIFLPTDASCLRRPDTFLNHNNRQRAGLLGVPAGGSQATGKDSGLRNKGSKYSKNKSRSDVDQKSRSSLDAASKSGCLDKGPKANASPKQGAYGKVKIHKEPLLFQLLLHPGELVYLFWFLFWQRGSKSSSSTNSLPAEVQDDLKWCNQMLGKVSRSFSTVIRQLPDPLRVDVLVFYLILRALDTIEDDTWTFADNTRTKVALLRQFHQQALGQQPKPYCLDNVGEGDEKILLQNFPKVQSMYQSLSPGSQAIIADITKRMASGMADTVGKDLTQGTLNLAQYNQYCHFVAGLVGEGLSRLFAQSHLEDPSLAGELYLSNQMGLFLQKTNIIRDYLEDYVEGRTFWPQSIWKKHAHGSSDLGYFSHQHKNPEIKSNSIRCLNELITDALELVPACLAYLGRLHSPSIFCFCAIPQVMAMATLAKCYANPRVFTGVVKIRKGLACKLMLQASHGLESVHSTFYELAKTIEHKANSLKLEDPSKQALLDACEMICIITGPAYKRQQRAKVLPLVFVTAVVACQFFPFLTLGLLVAALLNYYFGPFLP